MKMLLLKNWRDVKQRWAQFLALIILVALGITSYVAFTSAYKDLDSSYIEARDSLKLADFQTTVIAAPRQLAKEIEKINGVKAVQGRLIVDTGLDAGKDKKVMARIIGVPVNAHPPVNDFKVLDGGLLPAGGGAYGLVDNYFINAVSKKPGDKLELIVNGQLKEITIEGIVVSPEYLFSMRTKEDLPAPGDFAVIFMPQAEVEKMFSRPGVYNDFSVLLETGADKKQVIKDVEKALKPYKLIETVEQKDQPSNFQMQGEISQNKTLADSMPVLILVISVLALFIALSRLVESQRGEIGLAKALGYGNIKIIVHYLVFSIIIAIGGGLLGFALGQWFSLYIGGMYKGFLNLPYLKHQIYPETIWFSVLLSSAACLLAGSAPAYASARMLPAKAMRVDPNLYISKGKKPIVERILGRFFRIPFTLKIPIRNIFRVRRRSAYTIIGIAFAMILTVATWTGIDTLNNMFDQMFNHVEKWDASAAFNKEFTPELVKKVESWDGVKEVQPVLNIPVKFSGNGASRQTILTVMEPTAKFHGFEIVEGKQPEAALEDGGIILPLTVAEKLKLKVGDDVKVSSPYIKTPKTIRVTAVSDEIWGAQASIGRDKAEELMPGASKASNILYLFIDKEHNNEVKTNLYRQPGIVQVIVKKEFQKNIMKAFEFLNSAFFILLAFGCSMAFVITYNTFTTNILERSREIATMRTIGEDRRHLALSITLENVFLAIVGIPLGVWLGHLAAENLYKSLSSDTIRLDAVMFPQTYVYVVILILVVLLLSEIAPIRRVFRMDLAESTKTLD